MRQKAMICLGFAAALTLSLATGCNGTKRTEVPTPVDSFLPEQVLPEFSRPDRASYLIHSTPLEAKNRVADIPGTLVMIEKMRDDRIFYEVPGRYILKGRNVVSEIREDDVHFEQIIDLKTKTNIEIVSAATINLQANQKMHARLETIQSAYVEQDAIDEAGLRKRANEKWRPETENIFYIRAAMLNRLNTKKYSLVESGTKIHGTAFAVGNELFHSNESTSNSYEVVLYGFPLHIFKDEVRGALKTVVPEGGLFDLGTIGLPDEQLASAPDIFNCDAGRFYPPARPVELGTRTRFLLMSSAEASACEGAGVPVQFPSDIPADAWVFEARHRQTEAGNLEWSVSPVGAPEGAQLDAVIHELGKLRSAYDVFTGGKVAQSRASAG